MMKRNIWIVVLGLLMVGCAATEPSGFAASSTTGAIGFDLAQGALQLELDKKGELLALTATGIAQPISDSPMARETALRVATARAKRVLAEFLNERITSTDSVNHIAHSTGETSSYVQEVVEKIHTNAHALLQGAYVSRQLGDGEIISVNVSITPASLRGAHVLRAQLNGGLK